MRTLSPSLAPLCLLVVATLAACGGSCDDAAGPAAARPEPPEGLLAEVSITGTDALLRGLAEQSRSESVRSILPRTAQDLADRLARVPPAAIERAAPGASLFYLLVDRDGAARAALAIELTPGIELGPAVPLVDGGPHGSTFLFRRPGADEPAQVRSGDTIVWVERTADLEALLPYAVASLRAEGPPAVSVRVPDGVAGGPLRSALDARLESFVTSSRASLAAERARHDTGPALGDPEVALDRLAGAARALLAFLPDVGEVAATITAPPGGTDLDATIAVRDGSPLARAIAAQPVGPAFGLAALPPSTALALSSRRPEAGPPSALPLLRAVGGERIDAASDAALDAVEAELAEPAGTPSIVAMGGSVRGGWIAYGREAGDALRDREVLRRLVGVPYVAGVVGAAVGCEGAATPGEFTAFGPLDVAPVCERAAPPYPMLQWSREGGALAFGLTDQADPRAAPHPAPRELAQGLAGHTEGLLGADPDGARALEAASGDVLFAGVVAPSRIFASLALFDSPVLRRVAAAFTAPPFPAPTVVALGPADGGLRLRVRVAPRGVDHYVELAILVSRIFFGGDGAGAP